MRKVFSRCVGVVDNCNRLDFRGVFVELKNIGAFRAVKGAISACVCVDKVHSCCVGVIDTLEDAFNRDSGMSNVFEKLLVKCGGALCSIERGVDGGLRRKKGEKNIQVLGFKLFEVGFDSLFFFKGRGAVIGAGIYGKAEKKEER